jgi:prepilin-type N-terminal cleavage/methylation domain-containing protein/prepilin-type processing-associated H-X9-DG protein
MRIKKAVCSTTIPSRKGFTLIELLVVISIIAVLAGMISVVIKSIGETRNDTQRTADLKQIGVALASHSTEHDGRYPSCGASIAYGATDPKTQLPSWQEQLDPYVGGNRKLFAGPQPVELDDNVYKNAYFFGSRGDNSGSGSITFGPLVALKIERPSKYVLAGYNAVANMFTSTDADKDNYGQDPAFGGSTVKGEKKVPLLFADGHVKAFDRFDSAEMEYSYSSSTATR